MNGREQVMRGEATAAIGKLQRRVDELEAALRRIQCEVGCTVEAHNIIEAVIGTPQRPRGVGESLVPERVQVFQAFDAAAQGIADASTRTAVREFLMRAWHQDVLPALGVGASFAPCAETYAGCAPDCHDGNRCRTSGVAIPHTSKENGNA